MWFVQSVDPDSALLNICVSYRITGTVDITRLHGAVDAVAARHPVLHTTYETDSDGFPYPVIREDLRPHWAEHDLSGLTDQSRRLRLDVLAQRDFGRPFDLAKDSPLRVTVARVVGRRTDAVDHRPPYRVGRRLMGALLRRSDPRVHRRGWFRRRAGGAGAPRWSRLSPTPRVMTRTRTTGGR